MQAPSSTVEITQRVPNKLRGLSGDLTHGWLVEEMAALLRRGVGAPVLQVTSRWRLFTTLPARPLSRGTTPPVRTASSFCSRRMCSSAYSSSTPTRHS